MLYDYIREINTAINNASKLADKEFYSKEEFIALIKDSINNIANIELDKLAEYYTRRMDDDCPEPWTDAS